MKAVSRRAGELPGEYARKAKTMDTEYGGVAEGEVGPVARKLSSFPPGVGFWRLERGLPRCPQPCPLASQVEAEEGGGDAARGCCCQEEEGE